MIPIRVYAHYYLNEDSSWVFMLLDHMKMIEDSGLMDRLQSIRFTILANNTQAHLFRKLISLYPKTQTHHINYEINDIDLIKLNITAFQDEPTNAKYIGEQPTLRQLWTDSQTDEFYAFYFHNKGSSAFPNMFKTSLDIPQFKNYHYWRKYLEWGCIENWRDCVAGLEHHDSAGVGYNATPLHHYSGNFWWAKSTYIRKLDDIENSEWWKQYASLFAPRMISEFWPLSKAESIYCVHRPSEDLCDPNPGLYSVSYARSTYNK